ncbi:MAG: hypothetical protein U0670_10390 [Anaerolineae bacterium]
MPDLDAVLTNTHTIIVQNESAGGYNNALVELMNRFGTRRRCFVEDKERSVNTRRDANGSTLSIGSVGSVLSIGSTGSVLSIGSTGSILSIGSTFSVLSIGSFGAIGSFFSILSLLSLFSVLSTGAFLSYRNRRMRHLLIRRSFLGGNRRG